MAQSARRAAGSRASTSASPSPTSSRITSVRWPRGHASRRSRASTREAIAATRRSTPRVTAGGSSTNGCARRRRKHEASMSEPHIRKVRPDEIEEVWRVHVASSHDGMARRGQAVARPDDAPVASDARAALASDPDGYFCAVEDGRIRGMVSALVRGRLWYLSMFFVLPDDQSRGLGRALIERALAYGEARGAEIRFTWATLDPRAQARYVMAGMAPRWPIYRVDGDTAAVARLRERAALDPLEREVPCDPGVAEKLTAEGPGEERESGPPRDATRRRSSGRWRPPRRQARPAEKV